MSKHCNNAASGCNYPEGECSGTCSPSLACAAFTTLPRTVIAGALLALQSRCGTNAPERDDVIPALEAALDRPQVEQEPIGEAREWGVYEHEYGRFTQCIWDARVVPIGTKLYTHPQPKREPLTEDQIRALYRTVWDIESEEDEVIAFARAIEAALGIGGEA